MDWELLSIFESYPLSHGSCLLFFELLLTWAFQKLRGENSKIQGWLALLFLVLWTSWLIGIRTKP